jgi:hypothetical protein
MIRDNNTGLKRTNRCESGHSKYWVVLTAALQYVAHEVFRIVGSFYMDGIVGSAWHRRGSGLEREWNADVGCPQNPLLFQLRNEEELSAGTIENEKRKTMNSLS